MSEPAPIHEILPQIKQAVGSVGKSSRNQAQGFDFRGIDDVVNAVSAVLIEYGVTVYPVASSSQNRDVETSSGKNSRECTVEVVYRWLGPAGDYIDVSVPGEALDVSDKGVAKAMSVAFRIALLQTLTLPTHDRDPDADSYQRTTSQSQQTAGGLRSEIAVLAKQKGWSLGEIETDFRYVMNGAEITSADVATLVEYRDRLAESPDAEQ